MRVRLRTLFAGAASIAAVAFLLFVGFEVWRARPVLFPGSDFEFQGKHQRFHLFVNDPIDDQLLSVLDDAEAKLGALEIDEPGQKIQLYLCRDLDRFGELARIVRRSPSSQGFVLTQLHRTFISLSFIDEMRSRFGDDFRHTLLEGDPAHVITHEVVHILIADEVGFLKYRSLPSWKVEGYAEWAATKEPAPGSVEPSLRERLARFDAGGYGVAGSFRENNVRSQLMVEYLIEVKGQSFDQIFSSSVSESETWSSLTGWSASAGSGG